MKQESLQPVDDTPEEDKKVVPFKPVLVKSDTDLPKSDWWLRNIQEGYMFHTCAKNQIPCMFLQVLKHYEKTTILFDVLNQVKFMVHTQRFSQHHDKLEEIPFIPVSEGFNSEANGENEEENKDGTSVQV